jgi:hypothetical protein
MEDSDLLRRNQVLVRKEDGTRHRLLTFDIEANSAWLVLLGYEFALPYAATYSELPGDFFAEQAKNLVPTPAKSHVREATMLPLARAPSAAQILQSTLAWKRIEPLVDNPGLFDRYERARLLSERAAHPDGGTPKTLLKDLRAYWQGGQTQDALLGQYANCGRPDVVGTGGRGRKAKKGTQRPYQLAQVDYEAMRDVLETFYLQKDKYRTLTAALQELHERHYTYLDGNGTKCLKPAVECPSYRQLDYFLKENYPLEVRIRKRKGDKEFEQNHRSTEGSVQLDCHGVGHMYEFDATIADVLLVSTADKAAIVGKPTLYIIIDRASRMIVGWYAGFENASYTAAMQAILSLGEDKEKLCRHLGIDYDPADWIAHGILPEAFLADQGELTAKKARRIARSLRATLMNVPGLRPDWKPLVECGFAMLHQIIAPHTPAYSPDAENRKRRGAKKDKDVSLNIKQFTSLIVKAIITHNKTMQTGYPLSIAQVADGVPPIPRELYLHGMRRRMGKLDQMDFERVRAELMPRDKATITPDGLQFGRLFYSCPEAEARGWLVEGRRHRKPLEIAFDYRLVDKIVVFAPDGSGESFVASLTKDSVMFEGMALADVTRHFYDVDQLTAPAQEVKRQARFEYNQHAAPLIAAAKADVQPAVKGVARSSRKKDTAPARAAELAAERTANGGVRASPSAVPAASSAVSTTASADTSSPSAVVIPIGRGADQATPHVPPVPTTSASTATNVPMTLKERMAAARSRMQG